MKAAVAAALFAFAAAPLHAATLALVGGTLIDGTLREPIQDSVVLVEGERIVKVGRQGDFAIPAGAEIVSTEGMTVLPGLWDMHVHLMINGHADYAHWDKTYIDRLRDPIMPASAKQLLHAGVTGARDLGAPLAESIAVRDAIRRGEIEGPTLFVSGPFIQKKP
jgi:imidazolonepropionase-like amidohydrolase